MVYHTANEKTLIYPKPKKWAFITNLPGDAAGIVKQTFKKESLPAIGLIAASTGFLLLIDQPLSNEVHRFTDRIHLSGQDSYKDVISMKMGGKDVSILKYPTNINTALYQLGQGFPSLILGGGLYAYGKIKKDYRSLSTASQLAEAFVLMGIGTQIIKRISGRQTPGAATVKGGRWRPFPSFSNYQNHTPEYDAFPSGHLATLMSTVTIMTENFPEKKWIKPVGYTTIGLVGFAMINNDVHWASDYPLAIGLGYLCAKQVAKRNRILRDNKKPIIKKITPTMAWNYNKLEPGIAIRF